MRTSNPMIIIISKMRDGYIFRGRSFGVEEIEIVKGIVKEYWSEGRKEIARRVCERLNWRQINGRLKVASCIEALLRMKSKGIISSLPPCRGGGYRELRFIQQWEVEFKAPEEEIIGSVEDMGDIRFELVNGKRDEMLWRYLIQNYHYLGYRRSVGRYMRYLIYLGGKLVAVIGFTDCIYHHHLRDGFIGWDREALQRNRHLVINNVRFLVLPWVKARNLASKILSIAAKQVQGDWECMYGYRPVLIETFVDVSRFHGTCYKAANWIYLGRTSGEGRRGLRYYVHGRPKDLYIYPLSREYLSVLRGK